MDEPGLYAKYTVIKNATGEEVRDRVFILKPDSDPHARVALARYAASVEQDNPTLADDLYEWLSEYMEDEPPAPDGEAG